MSQVPTHPAPTTARPTGQAPADPAVPDPVATSVQVQVRRLDPGVPLPRYAMPGDAGADLVTTVDCRLEPGQRAVVPTGIAIALPFGFAAFVHPRSGLAAKVGLSIANTPGTIDAGYRGEVKLILINHDPRSAIQLRRGDRVAQLVVQRVEYAGFVEVDDLDATDRGAGGYGSTGGSDALQRERSETLGHLG